MNLAFFVFFPSYLQKWWPVFALGTGYFYVINMFCFTQLANPCCFLCWCHESKQFGISDPIGQESWMFCFASSRLQFLARTCTRASMVSATGWNLEVIFTRLLVRWDLVQSRAVFCAVCECCSICSLKCFFIYLEIY